MPKMSSTNTKDIPFCCLLHTLMTISAKDAPQKISSNDAIMGLSVHGVTHDRSALESNCVAPVRYRLPSEDHLLSLDQDCLQKNTHF